MKTQKGTVAIEDRDKRLRLYKEFYLNNENPPYISYVHWWLGYG
jgi:hypothetical protein